MNTNYQKETKTKFLSMLENDNQEEKIDKETLHLHFTFLSEIEKIIKDRKISKKELAEKVNTSASYITQLFRGDKIVNLEMLTKIKMILEIDYHLTVLENTEEESVVSFKVSRNRNLFSTEKFRKIEFSPDNTISIEDCNSLKAS